MRYKRLRCTYYIPGDYVWNPKSVQGENNNTDDV